MRLFFEIIPAFSVGNYEVDDERNDLNAEDPGIGMNEVWAVDIPDEDGDDADEDECHAGFGYEEPEPVHTDLPPAAHPHCTPYNKPVLPVCVRTLVQSETYAAESDI